MSRKGGRLEGNSRGKSRSLLGDKRAQSVVIGSILIFAIVILLLGVFQATVIPSANEDIEIEHSQQVRGQMQDLRNNVLQSAATGQDTRQAIKVGVEYPTRLLFINPGPTAGSIRTEGTDSSEVEIAIRNAEATDGETAEYLDGSEISFSTGSIVYQLDYNIFQSAPDNVTVENSLAYDSYSDGEFTSTGQQIVNGKEISLVALDGDLSQSEVTQYTVDTEAVSATTTTVPVQDTSKPISITISTQLSEETLIQDIFRSQIDANGGAPSVTKCSAIPKSPNSGNDRYINYCDFNDDPPGSFNNFTLVMEPGPTYTLELAKVGVGTDISQAKPTYLVDTEGEGSDIPLTGRQRLGFQVRDEFNNGIGGETLEVRLADNSDEFGNLVYQGVDVGPDTTVEVEPDGTVKGLYYQAPGSSDESPRDVTIEARFDSAPWPTDPSSLTQKNARFTLQVVNGSRVDRTSPLFNPTSGVTVTDVELLDSNDDKCEPEGVTCKVRVTFEKAEGDTVTVDEARYSFYADDTQSQSGVESFPQFRMDVVGGDSGGPYTIGGEFEPAPDEFDVGSDGTDVIFRFDPKQGDSNSYPSVEEGDWFVLELTIDGQSRAYFLVIQNDVDEGGEGPGNS